MAGPPTRPTRVKRLPFSLRQISPPIHRSTQPSLSKSPQAATPPLLPLRPIASVTSRNGLIGSSARRPETSSAIQTTTRACQETKDRVDISGSLQSDQGTDSLSYRHD